MRLRLDENNLVKFDMDGQPFKNLTDQIKYTLAYYRCSKECIDYVFKHFTEVELVHVIDGLDNPQDYEAEPDHKLLGLLALLTGVPVKMPSHIPNDHLKLVKKTEPELAKRNMIKIREMMKQAGILLT